MRLQNLFEEKIKQTTATIFSGGFHPFLPQHLYCWEYLISKFPNAHHYIASTNNISERPFSFKQKQFLAVQAGIPKNGFVQVTSPYKALEITSKYDSNNTIVIFGLSEKDAERLGPTIKKDGTLSFLLPYPGPSTPLETLNKHAYYVIIPVHKYRVLGQEITSASQIRKMYTSSNESDRYTIIRELYPNSMKVGEIKKIFDQVLLAPINEDIYDVIYRPKNVYNIEANEYPEFMLDGDVQRMIYDLHQQEEIDAGSDIWDRMDSVWYKLQNVSIKKLDNINDLDEDDDQYSDEITPFPPIVLTKRGEILDGFHRTISAKIRGDKTIRAYVPCKKPINESKAGLEYKLKLGNKKSVIDSSGWLFPDKTFVPLVPGTTHETMATRLGYNGYEGIYKIGCVRVSRPIYAPGKIYIETIQKLSDSTYKLIMNIIHRIKVDVKIDVTVGSGNGYFQHYKWDFKDRQLHKTNFYESVINEEPDFNYTKFNNRDEELSRLKFDYSVIPSNNDGIGGFWIIVNNSSGVSVADIDLVEVNSKTLVISFIRINLKWKGTGLGQILYDKAIKKAKQLGYKYFRSDTDRSAAAEKAWKRLAARYTVKYKEGKEFNKGYYEIDLSKVQLKESFDYSYRAKLFQLRPQMIKAAQKIYDKWEGGEVGLCDSIAESISDCVLKNIKNIDSYVVGHKNPKLHELHFWVRVDFNNGEKYYDIDLPFGKYERYDNKKHYFVKIPNVKFQLNDLLIYQSSLNYNKAPWEIRNSYTPHKSDSYFISESIAQEVIKVGKSNDEIIKLIKEATKYKLYVPTFTAQKEFGWILQTGNKGKISKMAMMYVNNMPVAWIIYWKHGSFMSDSNPRTENDKYWRFTKKEFRNIGYYHKLKKALWNIINEAPDFGYKSFNDRDEDISKLKWEIDKRPFKDWNSDEEHLGIIIRARNPETNEVEGFITSNEITKKTLKISRSQLTSNHNWQSTGLGQMLYDKLINVAKELGFDYVDSDYILSVDARKALKDIQCKN